VIFSATTLHGLRAVSLLVGRPGETALGRELAAELGVPSEYLLKVLARLARAGVLRARSGRAGGYRLARPAARIRVGEVVRPLEGVRTRPGCLLRPGRRCSARRGCPAHAAWSAVTTAYLAFLEEATVADLGVGSLTVGERGGRRPRPPRRRG